MQHRVQANCRTVARTLSHTHRVNTFRWWLFWLFGFWLCVRHHCGHACTGCQWHVYTTDTHTRSHKIARAAGTGRHIHTCDMLDRMPRVDREATKKAISSTKWTREKLIGLLAIRSSVRSVYAIACERVCVCLIHDRWFHFVLFLFYFFAISFNLRYLFAPVCVPPNCHSQGHSVSAARFSPNVAANMASIRLSKYNDRQYFLLPFSPFAGDIHRGRATREITRWPDSVCCSQTANGNQIRQMRVVFAQKGWSIRRMSTGPFWWPFAVSFGYGPCWRLTNWRQRRNGK